MFIVIKMLNIALTRPRLVAWYSGRTSVWDRRTYPVPRSTGS